MATKKRTIAASYVVEFEVNSLSEADAIVKVAPDLRAIEDLLNGAGYNVEYQGVKPRRPATKQKALEREARKRAEA